MATLIEQYGLIGDATTVALVSHEGSIDWLCLPRVDSDACFAQLLGRRQHGDWSVRPASPTRSIERRYRPETLILETEFDCESGRVRVIDFMVVGHAHDIIRIVEGLADVGPARALLLESPVPLQHDPEEGRLEASFEVRAGQRVAFSLAYYPSHEPPPGHVDVADALQRAESFWRDWAGRCTYQGRWREPVVRSLLTLKALTHEPTGGIVAAPTTSLPEELGRVRNWDYRYCWIRDSTLTLDALLRGGYKGEAMAWRDWLLRAAAGAPAALQIMYGVSGEHRLTEVELPWLPGYEESPPVRIGNGAYSQFQLDAYGEVIHTFYDALSRGLPVTDGSDVMHTFPEFLDTLVDYVEKNWQRTDEGIWEVRGDNARHFTHSQLLAWVAVDRAIRLHDEFGIGVGHELGLDGSPEHAGGLARRIREVHAHAQHVRATREQLDSNARVAILAAVVVSAQVSILLTVLLEQHHDSVRGSESPDVIVPSLRRPDEEVALLHRREVQRCRLSDS